MARPFVTLKLATSLDGRIATATGHSQWITSADARGEVHKLRALHDCVLTGIGTVLADDPEMTARTEPRPAQQPLRVVRDTTLRTPHDARLITTAGQGGVCLLHGAGHVWSGPEVVMTRVVTATPEGLDLGAALRFLAADHGIGRVFVEAGAKVAGAFLRTGLVDELIWFRAPCVIGGDGLSVFDAMGVSTLSQALRFERLDSVAVGPDMQERYRPLIAKEG